MVSWSWRYCRVRRGRGCGAGTACVRYLREDCRVRRRFAAPGSSTPRGRRVQRGHRVATQVPVLERRRQARLRAYGWRRAFGPGPPLGRRARPRCADAESASVSFPSMFTPRILPHRWVSSSFRYRSAGSNSWTTSRLRQTIVPGRRCGRRCKFDVRSSDRGYTPRLLRPLAFSPRVGAAVRRLHLRKEEAPDARKADALGRKLRDPLRTVDLLAGIAPLPTLGPRLAALAVQNRAVARTQSEHPAFPRPDPLCRTQRRDHRWVASPISLLATVCRARTARPCSKPGIDARPRRRSALLAGW